MQLFSQRKTESLPAYMKRIAQLGRYRLWLARMHGGSSSKCPRVNVRDHELTLPAREQGITEELRLFGVHEPHATEIYATRLESGMQVLEVGTNLGYYLAVADSRIGSEGRVIGVEPDPELFEIATKNAGRMAAEVTVKNFAVSDHNGKATFFQSNVSNWGSLHRHGALDQTGQIEVDTITIDSLVKGETGFHPDAIRMDIEGHEGAALAGAVETLQQFRPLLFIELHLFLLSDDELDRIISLLRRFAYHRFTVIDRYYDVPWSWHSARAAGTRSMDIDELKALSTSHSRPNVISIISDE